MQLFKFAAMIIDIHLKHIDKAKSLFFPNIKRTFLTIHYSPP